MTLDAAARRHAREAALQTLYSWEMSGLDLDVVIDGARHLQLRPPLPERDALTLALVRGTAGDLANIDPLIADAATNWRLERLAVLDRLVLRIATHELLLAKPDVPPAVVINEAIELARAFSGEEAARFVNGVLDAIRKRLQDAPGLTPQAPDQ
jgi:transcription antitermination protein NusB